VGANAQGITRPGTPAALGTALLNGFNGNGDFQTGAGFDFSPAMLYGAYVDNGFINHQSYADRTSLAHFLANLNLSAATAKGASNANNSVSLGYGLRSSIFDFGDPVADPSNDACVAANNPQLPPTQKGPQPSATQIAQLQQGLNDCLKATESAARLWNRSALSLSAAGAFLSPDGRYSTLRDGSYSLTASLAYGFDDFAPVRACKESANGASSTDPNCWENLAGWSGWWTQNAQMIVGVQYNHHQVESNPVKSGTFFQQDSLQLGSQFRMRVAKPTDGDEAPSFSFQNTLLSLEVVYGFDQPVIMPHGHQWTITVGAEFKLANNTYLDMGVGAQDKTTVGKPNAGFALTKLKYNLAGASSLFK